MRFVALLLVAAALPGAATPATTPGERTTGTRGAVDEISADGGRVAIRSILDVRKSRCMYASVWTPATNAATRFDDRPCVSRDASDDRSLDLTLAGSRVAWTHFEYGNHAYCLGAFTATLANPKPSALPNPCDPGEGVSDHFFRFEGDGPLLAYSSFRYCQSNCTDENYELLPDGAYDVTILTVVGGRVRVALEPRDLRSFLDAAGGRLLVYEGGAPSGALVVYTAAGRELRRLPILERLVDDAFFSGSDVVVRDGARVTVYGGPTLAKRASWPLRARALDDVDHGLAVYRAGGRVRIVDLVNGRDVAVATPKGRLVEAELEPAGLFYAFNVARGTKPGRVTFVPMATVRARLGR